MSKTVSFPLRVSGFPWCDREIQFSVTLGHREAADFDRFLRSGDHDIDLKGAEGTRLIGWPAVGNGGEELCAVTLEKDGAPIMALAMDWVDRMATAEALRTQKRRPSVP